MEMSSKPVVPVNPENWSESSKRSLSYVSPPAEYEDYHYKCWRCRQPAVFTAEAQREAYEVRQAYIWQKRHLCPECCSKRMRIEAKLRAYAESWSSDRITLQADAAFLQRWLALLEIHVSYGGRADQANAQMLRRVLNPQSAKRPEPVASASCAGRVMIFANATLAPIYIGR